MKVHCFVRYLIFILVWSYGRKFSWSNFNITFVCFSTGEIFFINLPHIWNKEICLLSPLPSQSWGVTSLQHGAQKNLRAAKRLKPKKELTFLRELTGASWCLTCLQGSAQTLARKTFLQKHPPIYLIISSWVSDFLIKKVWRKVGLTALLYQITFHVSQPNEAFKPRWAAIRYYDCHKLIRARCRLFIVANKKKWPRAHEDG